MKTKTLKDLMETGDMEDGDKWKEKTLKCQTL
jgi:hypothetical protein